ncbi:RimK family alpha-L-glutamate ligase [Candidatus Woesearchaeota archaeon]|nr:RimK family alpha-L-glutamate ligase [Candidatus Woesearchaeota archaeon]
MRLALISLGGAGSKMISEEARKLFDEVEEIDIRKIEIRVENNDVGVLYNENPLPKFDCVYIRGSFRYALLQRAISFALKDECYVPIAPSAYTIAHDKFLTMIELSKLKVSVPRTYFAATTKQAKRMLEEVNYPVILKIPSGTQGKGVMSADSVSSAKSMLDTLEVFNQPYLIQEFIDTDATDIRAIVAGDEVIACMKRKGKAGEMRSNIHQGGIGIPFEMDYDTERLAIRAAKAVKADICGVDLLEGINKSMVIEVNLSPGLKGITAATKDNVAGKIAKFLFDEARKFKSDSLEAKNLVKDDKIQADKELIVNLDIKAGRIRLPGEITKITRFNSDDEVVLVADKGKLEIKEMGVKKE